MIAKEGYIFIIFTILFTALILLVPDYIFIIISVILVVSFIFFFRDPKRIKPPFHKVFLSAADGEIIELSEEKIDGVEFFKASVFMSIFNVHVNRIPTAGEIASISHKSGKFMLAKHPKSSEYNEQNLIEINSEFGRYYIKQVAGMVARRTVCYPKQGDYLEAGDKIGIIKFSSRVDHYIPKTFHIVINRGDKVTAGETIIARQVEKNKNLGGEND